MIFKLIIQNSSLGSPSEITLRWILQNLTNEKSTLVQVMVWCCLATSHYLSQSWPRYMAPYGITTPHKELSSKLVNKETCIAIQTSTHWGKGRPRKTWSECVKTDISDYGLTGVDPQDRDAWRASIRCSLVLPTSLGGTRRAPKSGYDDTN